MRSTCCKLRSLIVMNYLLILRWRLGGDKLEIDNDICLRSFCIRRMSRTIKRPQLPCDRRTVTPRSMSWECLSVSPSQTLSVSQTQFRSSLGSWATAYFPAMSSAFRPFAVSLCRVAAGFVVCETFYHLSQKANHFHSFPPVSHVSLFWKRQNGMGMAGMA